MTNIIEWGKNQVRQEEIRFEFDDKGVWNGPWIRRIYDDLTLAVKNQETLRRFVDENDLIEKDAEITKLLDSGDLQKIHPNGTAISENEQ